MKKRKLFYFVILIALLQTTVLFAADVRLSWTPPTTNEDGSPLTDLSGYKIYYGIVPGSYLREIDAGNRTSYTVVNLPRGLRYYFSATAYDLYRNESDYSNEVSKIVPTCTNQPARIPGSPARYFYSVQSSYNAAGDGNMIQSQGTVFREHVYLDRNVAVILNSGYDCLYSALDSPTVIDGNVIMNYGKMVIGNGTLVLKNVD